MASKDSIAAIKRNRTARLARLATRSFYLHKRGRDEEMTNLICEEFVSLGGVYIKFLQGVMLQSQAMRRWRSPDRLNIFENLDSEPIDIVGVLRSELTPEQLSQITMIQPQSFAAGSFGQVYYGQHANGKQIIVKVLRPMVKDLLRYDLRLLGAFSRSFFIKLYKNMQFDLDSAIKDFREATLQETNYIKEAHFAAELYSVYRNHPKLVIPETFLDLCTKNIIVQEYIGGLSAAQLIKLKDQGIEPRQYVLEQMGSDLDEQLTTLGIETLSGVFNLERIQGDPHPGNIKLLPDNKIGMIDFGIAAETPKNKAAFFGLIDEWSRLFNETHNIANLFEQFIRFFVSDLYRALRKLSTMAQGRSDQANFAQDIGRVAQETFSRIVGTHDIRPMLADGRILLIFNQMVNKDNRFGLIMRFEASEILRAAQTFINLVESLGRRSIVLPGIFENVVEQVQREHPELRHQQDETLSVADALEIVGSWLERVAERDPALFRQITEKLRLGRGKAIPIIAPDSPTLAIDVEAK